MGFLEFLAGVGVGAVIGFVAGLTISPVTSTILGALATGLLVLLGFQTSIDKELGMRQTLRVAGFGISCSICLLVGVYLRTHEKLAPSLKDQDSSLSAVFADPEIRQRILLLTNYGLQYPTSSSQTDNDTGKSNPQLSGTVSTKKDSTNTPPGHAGELVSKRSLISTDNVASGSSAGLLRAGTTDFCANARREDFKTLEGYLIALDHFNPALKRIIDSAPPNYQDKLSYSLSKYLCH